MEFDNVEWLIIGLC